MDNPEYEKRGTIFFLGRKIQIPGEVRTGQCSTCLKTYPDDLIRQPGLHHTEYDLEDPLAHTVELCNRCHAKITDSRGEQTPALIPHKYNEEAFLENIRSKLDKKRLFH